jgi:glycosyltransferase involved in cell wall biosynthesis
MSELMKTDAKLHACLVVPCFNEASRLDLSAFRSGLRDLDWLHIRFVDDGSTDDTPTILESLRSEFPDRLSVMVLPGNRGKAEAVRQGLLSIDQRFSFCGFWDADLAAPLSEVRQLREALLQRPTLQWAHGVRLRSLGRTITRNSARHYAGRLFATATSILTGINAYDTQCGAKLFRNTALLASVIAQPFVSRWVFDVEMVWRADLLLRETFAHGIECAVLEIPLMNWRHQSGSKVLFLDFLRAATDLLRIRLTKRTVIGRCT